MTDSPWEPFNQLKKAIEAAVAPLGVTLEDWMLRSEDHAALVVFHIDPEAFKSPEQKQTDEQFEQMMAMEHEQAQRAKVEEAKDRAKKLAAELAAGQLDDTPDT